MLTQRVFSALVLLVLTVCCSADTLTPLIAWSNGDVLTSSQPSTVPELLLHSNLTLVNVAVVFKASKLTFDELAKFSGAYGEKNAALSSLQAELQSSSSTLWSGLSGQPASALLNSLAFTMDTSPRYVKDGDDLGLDKESLTLLVVRLPGGESEVGFALQGEVITQIMSNLRSSNPDATFLAFYTSDPSMNNFAYSSDYDSDEFYDEIDNGATVLKVHRSRQARQSGGGGKAKVETGDTLCAELSKGETTCVALCLTNDNVTRVEVTIENRMKKDGPAERLTNFRFTEGNCDFNHTMYNGPFLKAQANVNGTTEEVTLTFVFPQCIQCPLRETFNISTQRPQDNVNRIAILRKGFWRMDLYVEETPGDEKMYLRSTEGPRIFSQFEVPVGASYACGKNKLNHYEDSNTSEIEGQTTMQYRFNGIQAQINVKRGSNGQHFASAYNCQGYFSNVTWMGIFAAIIIIFFLYVANVFAFSVETIDRFDDPRGPTITVENLH